MPGLLARRRFVVRVCWSTARNRGIRREGLPTLGWAETLLAEHRTDRFIITCNDFYLTIPYL
jgi:sulfur relay (sulfurtransferase) complex TusBCD TusD component (DsrE family)